MAIDDIITALAVRGAIEVAEYGILNLKKVLTKNKRREFYSIFEKDSKIIIVPSSFGVRSLIYKVEGVKRGLRPSHVTGTQHAISLMLLTQFLSNFSLELLFRQDCIHWRDRNTNNLILTGSSASNLVTRWFCRYMGKMAGFSERVDSLWFNGKEITDPYAGMIVCNVHPKDRDKRIVLLAGVSQFGTSAAIRFFAASELLDLIRVDGYKGNWACLVYGEVSGNSLVRIHPSENGIIPLKIIN